MFEPLSTATGVGAASIGTTATSLILYRYLGPEGAEFAIIIAGAFIGSCAGIMASSLRGWRAAIGMVFAILIALFISAIRLPWLAYFAPAAVSFAIALGSTAPLVHAKSFKTICEYIASGITSIVAAIRGTQAPPPNNQTPSDKTEQ